MNLSFLDYNFKNEVYFELPKVDFQETKIANATLSLKANEKIASIWNISYMDGYLKKWRVGILTHIIDKTTLKGFKLLYLTKETGLVDISPGTDTYEHIADIEDCNLTYVGTSFSSPYLLCWDKFTITSWTLSYHESNSINQSINKTLEINYGSTTYAKNVLYSSFGLYDLKEFIGSNYYAIMNFDFPENSNMLRFGVYNIDNKAMTLDQSQLVQ